MERSAEKDFEICNKADKGPWKYKDNFIYYENWESNIGSFIIAETRSKNAEFIAMSRESLPYWITRAQQLEAMAIEWVSVKDNPIESDTEVLAYSTITKKYGIIDTKINFESFPYYFTHWAKLSKPPK